MERGEVLGEEHAQKDHEPKKTLNVQRSTFNVQRSTFNVQRSTFNAQRSTFNAQRSIGNRKWALGNGAGSWREGGEAHRRESNVSLLPLAFTTYPMPGVQAIDQTFIEYLGVIIIAAALFALGARRLRLPTIVAYLVAGLSVGPGLGLVEITPVLGIISEVGIVLLLFLVGLELSFGKIRGMGKEVLVAGIAQVTLTLGSGFLASWGLGFDIKESLILGITVTFSSTVVAVKLLEEKGEFNSLHGRLTIGVLLIQDLVVIVLLTLLSGFQSGEGLALSGVLMSLVKSLGGMAVLCGVVLVAARYLLPVPFAWAASSSATLFIWSLCWCFFVVTGAHWMHLSAESGAFLAGLGLAQLPYNHDLRRRVHPLMNFFIAVFFVSLGIQMEPGSMVTHWKAALALAAFVLVGKFLIVMGTLAFLGFGERTAHFSAVTLSQISEFSFILVAVLLRSGWADAAMAGTVGLVGLITIAVSACMILSNETIYQWMRRLGMLRLFGAKPEEAATLGGHLPRGHIIIVGMNTLGRLLAKRLHERGERVLAIDTDPMKLEGLPCETLLGNAEYLSVLDEANLPEAKLLVSALRIEPTNDLLAYRAHAAGVQCSVHVIDLSVIDNLLEMDVSYLMIPKVDGIKLQTKDLRQRGLLPS